jgi:hypothetical protein
MGTEHCTHKEAVLPWKWYWVGVRRPLCQLIAMLLKEKLLELSEPEFVHLFLKG